MNVRRIFSYVVMATLLAGCGGGGTPPADDRSGGLPGARTGGVEGRVSLAVLSRGIIQEREPNDSFGQGTFLGTFNAPERAILLGNVTAVGGADPFDGFHIELPNPTHVQASFHGPLPAVNEFQVGVYDPVAMQFVHTFEVDESPELISFFAHGSFDLVVLANTGGGDYELRLQFNAANNPISEVEPNDLPEEAQYLGALRPGEQVAVRGTGSETTDTRDNMLFAFPQACRLRLSAVYDAFDDVDILLLDASLDISAPTPLASFDGAPASPQEGAFDVPAGTLLTVQIRMATGDGPWTLTLTGEDPPSPAPSPAMRAFAPLANERACLCLPDDAPVYGLPSARFVAGGAICKLRCGDEAGGHAMLAENDCRVTAEAPDSVCCLAFDVPEAMGEEHCARCTLARIREIRRCDRAVYVEPNFIRTVMVEPDDTYYDLQTWHYEMINLPEAWDIETGSSGVIVAVLDTGERFHPDLSSRQTSGYDFISNPSSARDGNGYDSNPRDEGDLWFGNGSTWHGTHVAGTIGALSNNGTGVSGVTWATELMTIRVLGRFGGTDFDIAQGLLYAAGRPNASGQVPLARAHVANMSLGGPGFNQTLGDACAVARAAGVVVIAAAGNEGSSSPSYPAAYPGVVSVSAVGSNRGITSYSNFGATIDIAAPGGSMGLDLTADGYPDGVLSTLIDDTAGLQPIYQFSEGTSMACPHVAGVAALLLSADPTLSPADVEMHLFDSAQDLGAPGRDDLYGHGLVDAFAALRELGGGAAPGGPVLQASPDVLNFGLTTAALDVTIANVGGDGSFLDVTGTSATTDGVIDWITNVTLIGDPTPSQSSRLVRIFVSRAGLPEGAHRGSVEIQSNGGTQTIDVVVQAPSPLPPPPPDIDVYVVAVRVDEDEPERFVVVNPSQTLSYEFGTLPVGDYAFIASTDLDEDGVLCEDGEYCGAWPVFGDPFVLTVFEGLTWTNVNFGLTRVSDIGTLQRGRPIRLPAHDR